MYYFIEPMVEADIGYVQEIEHQSCNIPWSAHTYRRELRNQESSRYVVARASRTPPPPRQPAPPAPQTATSVWKLLFAPFAKPLPPPPPDPLIGYGGVWFGFEEAHITTIAVDPAYRGCGVGELLLNGLIGAALDAHVPLLTLEVRVSNRVAQALYSKYGFRIVGQRIRYYTDNNEDALILSTPPIHSTDYQAHLKGLRQQLFARMQAQAATRPRQTDDDGQIAYSS